MFSQRSHFVQHVEVEIPFFAVPVGSVGTHRGNNVHKLVVAVDNSDVVRIMIRASVESVGSYGRARVDGVRVVASGSFRTIKTGSTGERGLFYRCLVLREGTHRITNIGGTATFAPTISIRVYRMGVKKPTMG